jgi:hypothetical protein
MVQATGAGPLTPSTWFDDELEGSNDATAAACRDARMFSISPHRLNALICEVQAWRRTHPSAEFVSGPNDILPRAREE